MQLTHTEFRSKYGEIYDAAMLEAQRYVANPETLVTQIEKEEAAIDQSQLRLPYPDLFAYRMTRYRGFVRYPDRLENYVVSTNEPPGRTRSFLPTMMDVEPVSRCNFRCTMCTLSEWKNGKRAEDLTLEEFKNFVIGHPYIMEIKIQGIGEPLLHKEFMDMVHFVAERDIWARTTVNGSLLYARDNYHRLIDSGIGEVQISFDGATKEVFEKIRRRSNFDLLVRNLTLFNAYANTKDHLIPRMWVLVQRENRHQVFEFLELAKQMGFRRLTYYVNPHESGKEDWAERTRSMGTQSLTTEECLQLKEMGGREGIDITFWGSAPSYSTESPKTLCPMPFSRASVSSDSRLVPCSRIGNPDIVDLGDAKDFQNSWNGPAYQEFRQAHLDGNVPEHCRFCYKFIKPHVPDVESIPLQIVT